jgi:ferredoxin
MAAYTSSSETHRVEFVEDGYPPVDLPHGSELSSALDAVNSPVLFGCRSCLCATCLVEVEKLSDPPLPAPEEEESEVLEIYAPDNSRARLACQITLTCDLKIRRIV